jgi:hypothetical protein
MAVSMPVAMHQNVAVNMPVAQMGGVQFMAAPGVQQTGGMVQVAGWGRPVHGMQQQQQHPAQQQQHRQ